MTGSGAATMMAAREPRQDPREQRMLVVDVVMGEHTDDRVTSIAGYARPGDVWVLNDSGTLPASLAGHVRERSIELRLAGELPSGRWRAVLFGEGSWRDDTDRRPAPPLVIEGDEIVLGGALRAHVTRVDPRSPRLIEITFAPGGDAFWRALYAIGQPVQYSYLLRELTLREVSTAYAARPWSAELPSAGRPLTLDRLRELRRRGAEIVTLTHAAGLSATGDAALDALLPLPERYEIPEATARAVMHARTEGRRVVAVGTSVTRALEGSFATHGEVRAESSETDLRIGPQTSRHVVDVLFTGAHDPSSSHYELLRAFAPAALLERAARFSAEHGYLAHELGDSWLILAD